LNGGGEAFLLADKLERQVGVRLSVDVTLEMNLEKSGRSDRMADTIEFWSTHTNCVVALPADEQFAKDLDAMLTPYLCASAG
jgi:hypothetical protein